MKYLLIDTCVWIKLINKLEFDTRLKQLEKWIQEKYIQLLIPPRLANEWTKHRVEEKQKVETAVRKYGKDAKKILLLGYEIPESKIERAQKLLMAQIDLVDEFFKKSIHTEETENVVLINYRQKKNNKAPYHNKRESENDAFLIFSALEYLGNNDLNELYFFSSNYSDFGSPADLHSTLHPDISNVFPDVTVYYYSDYNQGFEVLKRTGLPKLSQDDFINNHKVISTIVVDKSRPFLDQINEYLQKRFSEIAFLPRHLFAQQYPFLISKYYLQRSRAFTIYTDNVEVCKLVSTCKVIDGDLQIENREVYSDVEDHEQKIRNVLQLIAKNAVDNIVYEHQNEFKVVYSEIYSCNCAMCKYSRFEYIESFKVADAIDGNFRERFKNAYTLYKLGNFFESAKRFKDLSDECNQQKQLLLSYIAKFNLNRLLIICRNQFYGEEKHLEIVEDLGIVDLDEERKLADNLEDRAILDWIHSNNFITDPLSRIHQVVGAIRIDFFNRNSGWNENTYTLFDVYKEVENFLNANFLVFEGSLQFESLADLYLEGLFASHGCHQKLGGRLIHFSDDILISLMHYSKAEKMRHYFSRYALKELIYKQDKENRSFVKSVCRIMDEWSKTNLLVEQYEMVDKYSFKEEYSQKLFTGLTLCSLLTLEKDEINNVGKSILSFVTIPMQGFHIHELLKCVSIFFTKKANLLDPDILYQFFRLPLVESNFLEATYLDALEEVLRINKYRLNYTERDFALFEEKFLQSNQLTKTFSVHLICKTYFFTDTQSYKDSIKSFIAGELEIKFDPYLYYDALIRNVIPIDDELFTKYVQYIKKRLKGDKINSFHYVRDYYTDPRIDEFINCWFKYEFPLDDEIKNDIANLGAYYKWILDIDKYDYLLFKPEWVWNHFTMYYRQRFRQSDKLKAEMLKQIEPPYDQKLLRSFIQIYSVNSETNGK